MSVATKVGLVGTHGVGVSAVNQNILVAPNNEGVPGCRWVAPCIGCIAWIGGPGNEGDRFPLCQILHLHISRF